MQPPNQNKPTDEWIKSNMQIPYLNYYGKLYPGLVPGSQKLFPAEAKVVETGAKFNRERENKTVDAHQNCESGEYKKVIESRILSLNQRKETVLKKLGALKKELQENQEKIRIQTESIRELQENLIQRTSQPSGWENILEMPSMSPFQSGQSTIKDNYFEQYAKEFIEKKLKGLQEDKNEEAKNKCGELQKEIKGVEKLVEEITIYQNALKHILFKNENLEAKCEKKSQEIKDLNLKLFQSEKNYKDLKAQYHRLREDDHMSKNVFLKIKEKIALHLGIARKTELPEIDDLLKKLGEQMATQAVKIEDLQKLRDFDKRIIEEKSGEIQNLQGCYQDYAKEIEETIFKKMGNLENEPKLAQKDSEIANLKKIIFTLQEQVQEKDAELLRMKKAYDSDDFPQADNEMQAVTKTDQKRNIKMGGESQRANLLNEPIEIIEDDDEHEKMQINIEDVGLKIQQKKEFHQKYKDFAIKNENNLIGKRNHESFLSNEKDPFLTTSGSKMELSRRDLNNERENIGPSIEMVFSNTSHEIFDEIMKKIKQG